MISFLGPCSKPFGNQKEIIALVKQVLNCEIHRFRVRIHLYNIHLKIVQSVQNHGWRKLGHQLTSLLADRGPVDWFVIFLGNHWTGLLAN